MAEFPGTSGGFLAGLGAVASTIAAALRSFIGITAAQIFRFLSYLKDVVLRLAHEVVIAAFRLGRALAGAVRDIAILALHGVRNLALWIYGRLMALSTWLREKFAPVLQWLHDLKERIKLLYDRFVKPVVDAIEFIRTLNLILETFHIHLLSQLDATLAQIEDTLRKPFIWVQQKITWLENTIDRIITLDGAIQRLTLLRGMIRDAPIWTAGFWNGQIDRDRLHGDDYSRHRIYPHDEVWAPGKELGLFYRGEGSRMDVQIGELLPVWRQAAGLDPPGPEEG